MDESILTPKAWASLDEAAKVLDITRAGVYERIRSRAIPGRKIGGTWLVPIWWINELVEAGTVAPDTAA